MQNTKDEATFDLVLLTAMKAMQRRRQLLRQELLASHCNILRQCVQQRNRRRRLLLSLHYNAGQMLVAEHLPKLCKLTKLAQQPELWAALQQSDSERHYLSAFRMSKQTFTLLCQKLEAIMGKSEFSLTQPLPIGKQVGVCLYRLATNAEYRVVGDAFGIHKSTVHKYMHKVVEAIIKLQNEFVHLPDNVEANEIAERFEEKCQLPNAIGAIGDTRIPTVISKDMKDAEHVTAAILLQGVVDDKYMFRNVHVEYVHTAEEISTILEQSALYRNANELLPQDTIKINNVVVPLWFAGDAHYPQLPWLMTPFSGDLTQQEKCFNAQLNSVHSVVDTAMERLRGRWQCLKQRVDTKPEFAASVVQACAILHNFLELRCEKYNERWSASQANGNDSRLQRNQTNEVLTQNNINAGKIRNCLKELLVENL